MVWKEVRLHTEVRRGRVVLLAPNKSWRLLGGSYSLVGLCNFTSAESVLMSHHSIDKLKELSADD
mgnify:CR=1 FL=1